MVVLLVCVHIVLSTVLVRGKSGGFLLGCAFFACTGSARATRAVEVAFILFV